MRVGLVVNPTAGRGKAAGMAQELENTLKESHLTPLVEISEGAGGGSVAAQRLLDQNVDIVLVVGGDGTVSETVQVLANTGTPLALYPGGTGNDFAKAMGWPSVFSKWPKWLKAGRPKEIDLVWLSTGRWVVNSLGFGFSGMVGKRERQFSRLGHWGYDAAVLILLSSHRPDPYILRFPGGEWEFMAHLVEMGNGPTSGGGFAVTHKARYDDGLLDVCLVEKMGLFQRFRLLRKVHSKTHTNHSLVHYGQWPWVELIPGRAVWGHMDGEFYRIQEPLRLEIKPGALTLWVS